MRILEVEISYYGRTYEEGKKIGGAMVSERCTASSSMVVGVEWTQAHLDADKLAAF